MKKAILIFVSILVPAILLTGCGTPAATSVPETAAVAAATDTPASQPTITSTPDPCAPGQIESQVQKVHKHMREFDDASILASNMPREQLSGSIADLQRIRREAEDETIPICLTNLKTFQVQHMNSVINTLISFMGGADQASLDKGISLARQQHDQYTLELARVLGLTVVPVTPQPTATATTAP
jgi:hypothetical protein